NTIISPAFHLGRRLRAILLGLYVFGPQNATWSHSPTAQLRTPDRNPGRRNNAIAALFMGLFSAITLSWFSSNQLARWTVGVLVGLVWANAFEYAYHRWLLHYSGGFLSKG